MSKYDMPLRERIVNNEPFTSDEVIDELDTLQDQINDYELVMDDVVRTFGSMALPEAPTHDHLGVEIPEDERCLDEATRGRYQTQLNDDRQTIRAKCDKRRGKDKQKHQNAAKGE